MIYSNILTINMVIRIRVPILKELKFYQLALRVKISLVSLMNSLIKAYHRKTETILIVSVFELQECELLADRLLVCHTVSRSMILKR